MYVIPRTTFARVVALLTAGGTARAIAAALGISRHTVASIRNGTHRYCGIPACDLLAEEDDVQGSLKVRCLGCGHTVALPCRICRDRHATALHPLPPEESPQGGPPVLELSAEQQRLRDETRTAHLRQAVERSRAQREPIRIDPFDQAAVAWQEPVAVDRDKNESEAGRAA